jgi:acyl dehydratase
LPWGRGRSWDELKVGDRYRTSTRTITEADLVNFITSYGFNEPLFFDEAAATSAGYAGRLVPGALTYCIAEGLVLQSHLLYETGLAFLGMDLKVHKPVFVGDTVHAVVEITESRPATSGNRGVVGSEIAVLNQHGDAVMTFTPLRLVRGPDNATT